MKTISKVTLFSLVFGLLAFGTGCGEEKLPASPEDIIKEALLNNTEVTKFVTEMKMTADLKGDVDGEKNELKGTLDISGTQDQDAGTMQMTFVVDGNMNADSVIADLEMRVTEDGVFAKIGKIEVSEEEIQTMFDMAEEEGYIGDWLDLTFMTSDDLMEGGYGEIDYEEGDPLPFKNIEYIGKKDVLGLNSYHFTADIDKDMVLGMMDSGDIADAAEFLEASEIKGEVYVAVNEMMLTGFAGTMTMDDEEMNGTMEFSFMINPTKADSVSTPDAQKEITEEDIAALMFGGAMMDPTMDMDMEFDDTMMMDDFEYDMEMDPEMEALLEELEAMEAEVQ
jgi:hypothetical protein